jgi:choice-of-anchor A domain-containing protein
MKLILVSTSALALFVAGTPVLAAGSAVQGLADLRQLDLIVTGKAFIGGNLSAGTFNNADSHGPFASSAFPSLTVGGNVGGTVNIDGANSDAPGFLGANIGGSGGTFSINPTPSQVYVGGTVGNYNPNGQVFQQNVAGLQASIAAQNATFISDLGALSKALAAMPTTAGSSYNNSDQNNDLFTAVAGSGGYAVINITGGQSAFDNASNFNYDIPPVAGGGYLPTIINISGQSDGIYSLNANSNLQQYDGYVLFNFVDATSISFNREVDASILAPLATISNSTQINGSVAVANFSQNGEVHLGTFLGGGATDGGRLDPARGLDKALAGAVPEPATWAMMLAGFGIAGACLRRRRGALAA